MSESAVSAKLGGDWFGAKPTPSETPVRARPSGVHPEGGEVERKTRSYQVSESGAGRVGGP